MTILYCEKCNKAKIKTQHVIERPQKLPMTYICSDCADIEQQNRDREEYEKHTESVLKKLLIITKQHFPLAAIRSKTPKDRLSIDLNLKFHLSNQEYFYHQLHELVLFFKDKYPLIKIHYWWSKHWVVVAYQFKNENHEKEFLNS